MNIAVVCNGTTWARTYKRMSSESNDTYHHVPTGANENRVLGLQVDLAIVHRDGNHKPSLIEALEMRLVPTRGTILFVEWVDTK